MTALLRPARAALAAATALSVASVASGSTAVAQAQVLERETVAYWRQTCSWQVDANGNPKLDADGNMVPILGTDGKQKCTTEPIDSVGLKGSSGKAKADGRVGNAAPNWADEETGSSELSIGAIIGIVGAIIAVIVGIGWVFVEDVNVRLLPAPRR